MIYICFKALHSVEISIRNSATITGKMVASEPGIQFAQLYYKNLEMYKEKVLKKVYGFD